MIKLGDRFSNTKGEECEVIEYNGVEKVTVKFIVTGNTKVFSGSALRSGLFKNPLKPSLAGVGFIGEGVYKGKEKGKITKPYELWGNMVDRCYSTKHKRYENYGGRGVSVCEEWHNFQNFAKWCYSQEHFNCEDYHLDKDLIGDGFLYSPTTCAFVPRTLNYKLCSGLKSSKAKKLGVYWDESKGKYFSSCTDHEGNKVFLGYCDDVEYLHDKYMTFKIKSVIKYVERLYTECAISKEVYQSIIDPKVLREKLNKIY